jgi:hypothetical membrane protein
MRWSARSDDITRFTLGFGIAVPLLYYGVQLVSAPFFPDFSFLGTTASELGSDRSVRPWIFNAGAILTGIGALVGSIGLLRALRRLGAHSIVPWLTFLAVGGTGLSALWAGIFPMPDPRHGGHPSMLIAMLAVPFVLSFALWRLGVSRAMNAYFVATIGLLLVMIPIMMRAIDLDMHTHGGLLQRIFGLTEFLPISVAACQLARRMGALPSGIGESHPLEAVGLHVDESH